MEWKEYSLGDISKLKYGKNVSANYARDQFLYFLVIGKSELATLLIAKKYCHCYCSWCWWMWGCQINKRRLFFDQSINIC